MILFSGILQNFFLSNSILPSIPPLILQVVCTLLQARQRKGACTRQDWNQQPPLSFISNSHRLFSSKFPVCCHLSPVLFFVHEQFASCTLLSVQPCACTEYLPAPSQSLRVSQGPPGSGWPSSPGPQAGAPSSGHHTGLELSEHRGRNG